MYTKNSPYEVPVQAGKAVYICRCGKTKNAPFCVQAESFIPLLLSDGL